MILQLRAPLPEPGRKVVDLLGWDIAFDLSYEGYEGSQLPPALNDLNIYDPASPTAPTKFWRGPDDTVSVVARFTSPPGDDLMAAGLWVERDGNVVWN